MRFCKTKLRLLPLALVSSRISLRGADDHIVCDLDVESSATSVFRPGRERDFDRVVERDRLKDGPQIVKAVRPASETSRQVDLGERLDPRSPVDRPSIMQQRIDIVVGQFLATPQEIQFDHEPVARDCPPSFSTSRATAAAVPPVARTSSTISTRCPSSIASLWISSRSVPYSSSYSQNSTSQGASSVCAPEQTPFRGREQRPERRNILAPRCRQRRRSCCPCSARGRRR